MKKQINNAGFTIIELIIVMAIIAILAAAMTATFNASLQKGNDARRKSDLKQIQTSLESYLNDYGKYPAGAADGKIYGCGTNASQVCDWGGVFQDDKGTIYMAKIPQDMRSTLKYMYVVGASRTMYQLYSALDNNLDPVATVYAIVCGTDGVTKCLYGVSSSNTTPGGVMN